MWCFLICFLVFYFLPVFIFKVSVLSFLIITFKAKEVINTEFQQVRDLLLMLFCGFLTKYHKLKVLFNTVKWSYTNFLEAVLVCTKGGCGKLYIWILQDNTKAREQFVNSSFWLLYFPTVLLFQ